MTPFPSARPIWPVKIPQTDHMTLPLELEDGRSRRLNERTLIWGGLVFVLALVWSALTPIREIAIAPGELAPSGQIRTIQHLEGGVVSEIFARDGQIVQEGQPIVMLAMAGTGSDLGTLRVRREALLGQQEQLRTLLDNAGSSDLKGVQRQVLDSRLVSRRSERDAAAAKVDQRKAEVEMLEAEAAHLDRLVMIQEEQLAMRRRLAAAGHSSRRQLLDAEAALEQARQQRSGNAGRQAAARDALQEARQNLQAGEADARRQWSEEAAKVAGELAEVDEAIRKHQDRFDRLVVRAPVQGIVLQLVPRSTGEVVRPGDPVARFVPSSEPLVAELRIRPSDIAEIKIGDKASVTIAGTDPRIHGALEGEIVSISATTIKREQGEPYYLAQVAIVSPQPGGAMPALVPGMVVRGEVVTGAKTLLRYLLRPVYDTLDVAFRER